MFTFGSSPVLDLDNARLFAQQFQLEEDRPTLRRIARASALCHHDLVQYEVVSTEDSYECSCPDPVVPCKHIIACRWVLHCYQSAMVLELKEVRL